MNLPAHPPVFVNVTDEGRISVVYPEGPFNRVEQLQINAIKELIQGGPELPKIRIGPGQHEIKITKYRPLKRDFEFTVERIN